MIINPELREALINKFGVKSNMHGILVRDYYTNKKPVRLTDILNFINAYGQEHTTK